jgi:hypothetical protein
MRTRCLSIHAAYRCRHSGDCCQAGWDIDIEPHIVEAVTSGRIIPLSSTAAPFVARPDDTGGMTPARTADGWCGFRNDHRCSLQEAGGEAMLPSACRHFPRVILRDGRGTLLTLSHFCPTAAAGLFDDRPLAIVETGPPLAPKEPIEGLDARDALPPLVRPGMLSDIEGYGAWEEAVIREFAGVVSAPRALERIAAATESVRGWTPGRGALADVVAEAFAGARGEPVHEDLSEAFGVIREVTGPHPLLRVDDGFVDAWTALEASAGQMLRRPVANYMAACAFGNWTAYRGQGLRTIVAWLRGCYDVLRLQIVRQGRSAGRLDAAGLTESFRMADFIVVHNVPSTEFGRAAAAFEQSASATQAGGS